MKKQSIGLYMTGVYRISGDTGFYIARDYRRKEA